MAAVRRRGALDEIGAERVCRAVLDTLADQLPSRLRNSVAGYLPPDLDRLVRDDLAREDPVPLLGGQHDLTMGDVVTQDER